MAGPLSYEKVSQASASRAFNLEVFTKLLNPGLGKRGFTEKQKTNNLLSKTHKRGTREHEGGGPGRVRSGMEKMREGSC